MTCFKGTKNTLFSAFMLFVALCSLPMDAREVSTLEMNVIQNFNFGTWATGNGSPSDFSVQCVASSNYSDSFTEPPPIKSPPAERLTYNFKVIDQATAAGYYLYLNNDTTNVGNARIAVQFSHRDIIEGTGYEVLQDDVYGSHSHRGGFRLCKDGDNSELKVDISSVDLEQAQAGVYRGYFTTQVQGGSTATDTDTGNFRIDIQAANIVRVSALANINIGSYVGAGSLLQEESFCAYSNNVGADYTINISATNQDAGGNFFVTNALGTASIPYLLQFKADTTPGGGTTVTTTTLAGIGSNTDSSCNGVDNAKLTLSVIAADLTAALPDVYADTITLTVAPL